MHWPSDRADAVENAGSFPIIAEVISLKWDTISDLAIESSVMF